MIVDVMQCASNIEIRRARKLPFPGDVLVQEGEKVDVDTTIARANLTEAVQTLDFAGYLGVQPEVADPYLVRGIGEEVDQDDIIAELTGQSPRYFRTPVSGKIVTCHQGRVTLETATKELHVNAGMIGTVDEIIPEWGAVLTAQGSLVQGLWGNGKTGQGELRVLDKALAKPLKSLSMDTLIPGQVLAAGLCLHVDVLVYASDRGLAGLVLGGLAPELIPITKALAMPVIVLHGFGGISPDPSLFSLLKSREGAVTCVNASAVDAFAGCRPEVTIPHIQGDRGARKEIAFRANLRIGQQVRVMSGRCAGQTGTLVALSDNRLRLESGLETFMAVIQLMHGDTIQVPCQNLVITS